MRHCLLLIAALLIGAGSWAQQKLINGKVLRKDTHQPLAGVTIETKNKTSITDENGSFSINANEGEPVNISFVGFKKMSLKIPASGDLLVEMENDVQNLDEVVVVGYTQEKKKDLKGAVTVLKVGESLKENNANLIASLQGRVPGLVVTTDGAPGTGTSINIRGVASILGNIQPLYIIDGVPTYDINGISPNDIESLQVLKDAASAAVYGARGSTGVIVITTKKGKEGKKDTPNPIADGN